MKVDFRVRLVLVNPGAYKAWFSPTNPKKLTD
jgi:hypothetical protein